VKKKIEYSKQLNASRIKVLQTREDVVHGILDEVRGAARRMVQSQLNEHRSQNQRFAMTRAA
jgi:ATP synthase (E/31 kDa) subunit